jgi:hypothetical protein
MAKEQTKAEKPPRLKIPAGQQSVNPPAKTTPAAAKSGGDKKVGG